MTTGILKEPISENRVSFLPEQASLLAKQKVNIVVEKDAGANAFANDENYTAKGFQVASRNEVLQSDILLSIHTLTNDDLNFIKPGAIILGVFQPLSNAQLMQQWAAKGITTFSVDMIPRTTRAQSMILVVWEQRSIQEHCNVNLKC